MYQEIGGWDRQTQGCSLGFDNNLIRELRDSLRGCGIEVGLFYEVDRVLREARSWD